MRVALFTVFVLALCIYAWRDWFIPVCVLVVMDAVMKHSDMPRTLFGIQGLNLWNLLLAFAALAWLKDRTRTGSQRDVPAFVVLASVGYIVVIVVACLRGVVDLDSIRTGEDTAQVANTPLGFFSDYLINPLKYILVAFLLYEGARTRKNLLLGFGAIFGQAMLYAARVIWYVPPSVLAMPYNPYRDRIQRECGLHPNDMALVMVLGLWGLVACGGLWRQFGWCWRVAWVAGLALTAMALGLTQSRAGYLACIGVGLTLGIWRWKRLLVIIPIGAAAVCVAFPNIPARLAEGFGVTSASGEEMTDLDTVSAGRLTNLYPNVIEEIGKSPLIGFGRLAILRTSVHDRIRRDEGNVPTHPHSAYLEMLLDSGLLGLLVTLAFLVGLPVYAARSSIFEDPLLIPAAATGLAGASAILIMGFSGQSFFPREGVFLVLCAYALMMRAYITARRQYVANTDLWARRRRDSHPLATQGSHLFAGVESRSGK